MASRKTADSLPPIPPSLKAVSPFLQRAEELRTKDPIMAYWCTYRSRINNRRCLTILALTFL